MVAKKSASCADFSVRDAFPIFLRWWISLKDFYLKRVFFFSKRDKDELSAQENLGTT